jgi:hypothetical protein
MVTVVIMVDSCGLWDFLRRRYEFLRRIFGDDLELMKKAQFHRNTLLRNDTDSPIQCPQTLSNSGKLTDVILGIMSNMKMLSILV